MRARQTLAATALVMLCVGTANGFEILPNTPEEAAVLALLNDMTVDHLTLDDDARLYKTAAYNVIHARDGGADGDFETTDDNAYSAFTSITQVDDISGMGPTNLQRLLDYAIQNGYADEDGDGDDADVIFSPQPYQSSHIARVTELIRGAEHTIDIAMYSYGDNEIQLAIEQATARGVNVRFIFDTAGVSDRKLEGSARASSKSGKLEAAGVDVRYINKIMHHKYMIVDGPKDECDRASTARIASGSANWSYSAATKYDENTMFLQGYPEVAQALQVEYDHMWNNSREFSLDESVETNVEPDESTRATCTEGVVDTDPNFEALMTSGNFFMYRETTFSADEESAVVRDGLIDAILNADSSVWIASGHMRTPEIADALIERKAQGDVDIRVYLDAQEYRSSDSDSLMAYRLAHNDIDLRFKYYAYKWNYTYAPQMHHKYMIIDGDELYSGSYNISANAEWNTFENVLHFSGDTYAHLVDAYVANHAGLWETDRDKYEPLLDEIENGDRVPLLFDSMALTWYEVKDLKSAIYANCPTAQEDYWYSSSNNFSCARD